MYAHLFASMYQGSMMGKANLLLVFPCLLAHADKNGNVDLHPRAIAALVGIDESAVRQALLELEAEDEESRTKDPQYGGRRIVRVDEHRAWGWFIVNYLTYRGLIKAEAVREKARVRQERKRSRDKSATPGTVTRKSRVSRVTSHTSHVTSPLGEGEGEGEGGEERASAPIAPSPVDLPGQRRPRRARPTPPPPPTLDEVRAYWAAKGLHGDPERFHAYHETRGWLLKDGSPILSWHGAAAVWNGNEKRYRPTPPANDEAKRAAERAELNRQQLARARAESYPPGDPRRATA